MPKFFSLSPINEEGLKRRLVNQHLLSIFMTIILLLLVIFSSGVFSIFYTTVVKNDKIRKPLTDSREYEVITLRNGLTIALISDVNATRSGFSMTTCLGIHNTKIRYPGISKLLQNKLITPKLKEIIKKYVGRSSFEVHEEKSTYYFDINSEGFYYALEEVGLILDSGFNYYDKNGTNNIIEDLKAVNQKDVKEDYLVNYLLLQGSGRYETVYDGSFEEMRGKEQDILDNLKELFNIYYSPKNIKIALVSNSPLYSLKGLAVKMLRNIKSKSKEEKIIMNAPIPEKKLSFKQFIWSKPKTPADERVISIYLYSNEYKLKGASVLSYFVYILEGERPDSIYYYLANEYKFIDSLSIEIKKSITFGNFIEIKMKLTKEGIDYMDYVVKVVYGLIKSIHLKIKTRETYSNVREILNKKFNYITIDKYSTYLNDITYNLFNITDESDYSNLLYSNYHLDPFDEKIVFDCRDYLTLSHSMIVFTSSNSFNKNSYLMKDTFRLNDDEIEKIEEKMENTFGFTYLKGEMHSEVYQEQIDDFAKNYKGKNKNPYLTSLNTISPYRIGNIRPLIDDSKMKLWIREDTTFMVPRIHSYFRLIFPDVRTNNIDVYKTLMLYVNHLEREILLTFDEAKLSGNEIVANIDESGINIKVAGYKDVYLEIIYKLFSLIIDVEKISLDEDYDYKRKRYRNINEKALNYLGSVIKPDLLYIDPEDPAPSYGSDQLLDFFEYSAENMYLEGLVYGDVDDEMTRELKELFGSINSSGKSTEIEEKMDGKGNMEKILEYLSYNTPIAQKNVHLFQLNENFSGEDENFFISFFQIGKRDNQLDILCSLAIDMFNRLNPEIEGTIEKVYKDNIIYIRTLIKSYTQSPMIMGQNFERKMEMLYEKVSNLAEEDFTTNFNYVKRDLTKKDLRLRHRAIKYWYEIYERTFDFKRSDSIKEMIEKAKVGEYFNLFKNFVIEHLWNNVKKVEFWTYHKEFIGDMEETYPRKNNANVIKYEELQYIKEN